MNPLQNPPAMTLDWMPLRIPQTGISPDWTRLPDQNRQEMLTILADMLLNSQKKTQEEEADVRT